MSTRLKVLTIGVILVVLLSFTSIVATSSSGESSAPERTTVASAQVTPNAVTAYEAQHDRQQFIFALQMQALADYIKAQEVHDYLASLPPPPPPPVVEAPIYTPTPVYSAPTVTGACGGATNGADQYITRESGGDPTVLNGGSHADTPFNGSGLAFGCYQIMPDTWNGACGPDNPYGPPIMTYDPASQAACASRLPGSAWAM